MQVDSIDLIEVSSIFTYKLQKEVAKIIEKNHLQKNLVDFFKSETHYHVDRVKMLSTKIAKDFNLSDNQIKEICDIAPFHDFGKLTTPPHILNKPGKLTEEEFEIIKKHPKNGFNLLKNSDNHILKLAAIVAYEHHEHYDGNGYPRGLVGEEIDLYARIIAIADVFDSLISPRTYKKPWNTQDIYNFFKERRAKQFDPVLIDILLKNFDKYLKLHKKIYYC